MNSLFADFLPVTALNCDAKKKELISALKNGDITPIEGVDIVREVIADPDSDGVVLKRRVRCSRTQENSRSQGSAIRYKERNIRSADSVVQEASRLCRRVSPSVRSSRGSL